MAKINSLLLKKDVATGMPEFLVIFIGCRFTFVVVYMDNRVFMKFFILLMRRGFIGAMQSMIKIDLCLLNFIDCFNQIKDIRNLASFY